jgi:hypothetical protein
MPGTRRVKVNRVNGETYPVHTGLPRIIIAGPGSTTNAICGTVNEKGNYTRDPKSYLEKVDVGGDRELQSTYMLTCILLRCQILGGAIHGDFIVVHTFARNAQQNRDREA